jgi:cyclopropane-fatty-acyl-phospholipid synthase
MQLWDNLLDRLLRRLVQDGGLTLHSPDGTVRHYGSESGPTVRLKDPALPRRLVLRPDMAMGEAYVAGDLTVDNDDIAALLALVLRNADAGRANHWRYPMERVQRIIRLAGQITPVTRARANVAHHYDLSEELYRLFLDQDMQYSCAYFKSPTDTLDEAQAQKKAHIAAKLRLQPGMRVLDIGCGWGGMALTLARDHGVRVTGITLSAEQHRVATARAIAAGLSDMVEFRLIDYRELTGTYDRIVSVGMFEHVGVPQYSRYFTKVRDLLTPDGVALIHTIGRMSPPGVTSPWINKYIFPGGYVPALSEVAPVIEKTGLWLTDAEVWRLHYAETLLHWRTRFESNLPRIRGLYDDRFCRMWRYYLASSEMTFRHHRQCVFQMQLSRKLETVPMTRDYIYNEKAPAVRAGAQTGRKRGRQSISA